MSAASPDIRPPEPLTAEEREWIAEHAVELKDATSPLVAEQASIILRYEATVASLASENEALRASRNEVWGWGESVRGAVDAFQSYFEKAEVGDDVGAEAITLLRAVLPPLLYPKNPENWPGNRTARTPSLAADRGPITNG